VMCTACCSFLVRLNPACVSVCSWALAPSLNQSWARGRQQAARSICPFSCCISSKHPIPSDVILIHTPINSSIMFVADANVGPMHSPLQQLLAWRSTRAEPAPPFLAPPSLSLLTEHVAAPVARDSQHPASAGAWPPAALPQEGALRPARFLESACPHWLTELSLSSCLVLPIIAVWSPPSTRWPAHDYSSCMMFTGPLSLRYASLPLLAQERAAGLSTRADNFATASQ
jgi:hypothetical protein